MSEPRKTKRLLKDEWSLSLFVLPC